MKCFNCHREIIPTPVYELTGIENEARLYEGEDMVAIVCPYCECGHDFTPEEWEQKKDQILNNQ